MIIVNIVNLSDKTHKYKHLGTSRSDIIVNNHIMCCLGASTVHFHKSVTGSRHASHRVLHLSSVVFDGSSPKLGLGSVV